LVSFGVEVFENLFISLLKILMFFALNFAFDDGESEDPAHEGVFEGLFPTWIEEMIY
jgi:hypothetical protein